MLNMVAAGCCRAPIHHRNCMSKSQPESDADVMLECADDDPLADAISETDPASECCEDCGKPLDDLSEIGCPKCDWRRPDFGSNLA
jgi:hypothetical protein